MDSEQAATGPKKLLIEGFDDEDEEDDEDFDAE